YTFYRTERTVFVAALTNTGDRGNFFGAIVTTDPVAETLTVTNATGADAQLHLVLQGGTDNYNHVVSVTLNGHELGPIRFANQTRSVTDLTVPASWLSAGDNLLVFTALGGWDDVSVVETASITYAHTDRAEQNALALTAPATAAVTVTGFTTGSVRVFDLTDPAAPLVVASTVATAGGRPPSLT